ncbi:MAG: hydrogenase formation protein HypD [Chloroflexota bacterium]|nr:MAG: hydrogenase formation protein HypD [Chloroflexota bacterium]
MKYLDEYRDGAIGERLLERLRQALPRPLQLMEVCGTHTVALFRSGLRDALPEGLTMLSGPGCPVCVTAQADLDRAVALARQPGVTLVTFGDMLRVPASRTSLEREKAAGWDIRVVYSPLDALAIAESNPRRQVVFYGVGFETTAPTVAHTLLEARRRGLANYFVLSVHKTVPGALAALLDGGDVRIDGFLCPGHVSTIIGTRPYEPVAQHYGISCVVGGFEPLDLLQALLMLVEQAACGEARVENQYRRAVREDGNLVAQRALAEVFEPCDVEWRGLGVIPGSGLRIRPELAAWDAERAFELEIEPPAPTHGCRCADVLRGALRPVECPLFAQACTPQRPIGPCMVSSEGACAAYFQYGRNWARGG